MSASLTVLKRFTVCITTNLWKILKVMGVPDHFTCLLRNLYVGQEETVRTGHRTTDWFQIGKGVRQGCILSPCLLNLYSAYKLSKQGDNIQPCLLNLYAEYKYNKQNARLDESQAGIKFAGGNINNFRNADDTTLMTENER